MNDPAFVARIRAAIAILAGILWAIGVAAGILFSLKGGSDPGFTTSDGMTYFMPALTALVGGVVAVAFGVPTTDPPPPPPEQRLAALLAPKKGSSLRNWIGRGYVIVYLTLGLVAAVTWVVKQGDTIEYVRTLAAAWGGLAIPIAGGYFAQDS